MMKKMGTKSGAAAMKAMLGKVPLVWAVAVCRQLNRCNNSQQMGKSKTLWKYASGKMPSGLNPFGGGGSLPGLGVSGRKKYLLTE